MSSRDAGIGEGPGKRQLAANGQTERSAPRRIEWGSGRSLDLSDSPLVMGIINATPDSFHPASRALGVEGALGIARRMMAEGADLLDIGGESTRPGADPVDPEEELHRVAALIEAIRRESPLPLSVDTRRASVARAALDAGADIVNDISALSDDPDSARLVAERGAPVVLMHRRGDPKTMQDDPRYEDTLGEIEEELRLAAARALAAGIPRERIILDPGIGFGKRLCDNLLILRGIPRLKALGFPILIGLSRKAFIGKILGGLPVEERLVGTIVADTYAACAGADILRVHDVAEAVAAKRILQAIAAATQER